MADYKWRTSFEYKNSLDPNYHLSYGVDPSTYDTWQTTTAGQGGSGTFTYYYRDSNTMYSGEWVDSISSRCAYSVTQTWTTSIDLSNNLTVSVDTIVNSIVRDDIRGTDQNTPGRNIAVYKEQGGTALISLTDNQVATAHAIQGTAVSLGNYTFTLAPGESATKNTLYIHNQTVGGQSYDDIWAGVQFMNPLPAPTVYRITYNGNGGSPVPPTMGTTSTASSVTLYVATAPTPTQGSYKFLGWSLTQISGSGTAADVDYNPGDAIILYETNPQITLYAVWEHDYRPGAIYNGSNDWLSHNRSAGCADIYDGSTWNTMRTLDGSTGTGNPPEIYDGTTWHNMRKIGTE